MLPLAASVVMCWGSARGLALLLERHGGHGRVVGLCCAVYGDALVHHGGAARYGSDALKTEAGCGAACVFRHMRDGLRLLLIFSIQITSDLSTARRNLFMVRRMVAGGLCVV